MSDSKSDAEKTAETLWTAVAGATTWDELLRRLEELPADEREKLVRRCSAEAKDPLRDLLRPYETEVSRETILRTLG